MRVFIAGATGAIGFPVVKKLVAAGHQVIGLTRNEAGAERLRAAGAEPVIGNALDAAAIERIVIDAAPTHLVHLLTALPKFGAMRWKDLDPTNVLRREGTPNLLRAAQKAGVKRVIAESFPLVVGFGDHGITPLSEDDPLPPASRDVTLALRDLESQMMNARGIETIVLRYGYLYGASSESTMLAFDALRARKLPLVRGAKGIGSFLDLNDAADATIAALEHGRPQSIYNIVDDEPVGISDFFTFAAESIGAPRPRALPAFILKLFAPVIVEFANARLPLSNAKAKRELGWSPAIRDYREGLRAAAALYSSARASRLGPVETLRA